MGKQRHVEHAIEFCDVGPLAPTTHNPRPVAAPDPLVIHTGIVELLLLILPDALRSQGDNHRAASVRI